MSRAEHPWSKTSPDQTWDAIVIGSGMGGMTAAAFLAELGKKVLVLEQHYVPGGFTHTFRRKQWRWDVGVHAVGEVSPKSLTGRLLRRLSGGQLEWASLGPVYDEFWYPGGFRIDFPDRPDQFRQNLISAFPEDRMIMIIEDASFNTTHKVAVVNGRRELVTLRRYGLDWSLPMGALSNLTVADVDEIIWASARKRESPVVTPLGCSMRGGD